MLSMSSHDFAKNLIYLIKIYCIISIIEANEFNLTDIFISKASIYENLNPSLTLNKYVNRYFNQTNQNVLLNNKELSLLNTNNNNNNNNLNQQQLLISNNLMIIAPAPLGQKPDNVVVDDIVSVNKGPQPFTILMNFQNDGTTSLQILNQHNLYWSDLGNCRHGQIFDPSIGVCRDVFCMEGYVLSPQGCIADSNYNKTAFSEPIKKPPAEMQIEITLTHKLCTYFRGVNDTNKCNHEEVMVPTEPLLIGLKQSLSKILQVNITRIEDLKLVKYELQNDTTMFKMRKKRNILHNYDNYFLNDNNEKIIDDLLYNKDDKLDGFKIDTNEILKISFLIKDSKLFKNETKETIILFYYLTMLALDERYFNIKNHKAFLTDVSEVKQSTDNGELGWCNSPGDEKLYIRSEFRILASFDEDNKPKYYVYVNQTETLYSTGYYYLTVLYQQKKNVEILFNPSTTSNPDSKNLKKPDIQKLGLAEIFFDLELQQLITDEYVIDRNQIKNDHTNILKLTDVTDIVLDQNSSNIVASKLLTVCNRSPKIRVECEKFETIRLSLCELELMKDRSYCSLGLKSCYFIDEYEYDSIEPDKYIRICKSYKNHTVKTYQNSFKNKIKNKYNSTLSETNRLVAGWVSVISTIISIFFMLITLITYFLFNQIRNLPGWNIISVTLALIIAHVSFLLGSFFNEVPLFCFIIGITTHYGFLASFFWMNVIAFDLFRNFREKSSHILLQRIRLKERLPKYSLYAWLSPLVIVLICLITDFSIKGNIKKSPYRPCYSGYLNGCNSYESETFYLNNDSYTFNKTDIFDFNKNFNSNTTSLTCMANSNYSLYPKVLIINGPCWIRNGRANLIYFGLPIAVIILINGIFYFLTIYNIRKKKFEQKKNILRRFSKVKLPGDEDVKFYIQMAVIMGFTWIIGFFLTTTSFISAKVTNIEIVYNILTYLFILLNASTGVFIFFAFLFRKEVKLLYKKYLFEKLFKNKGISLSLFEKLKYGSNNKKSRYRENSQSSTSNLYFSSSSIKNPNLVSTFTGSSKTIKPISTIVREQSESFSNTNNQENQNNSVIKF